jgi:D-glycero-D-manno-heptose 1,7-bisphosphate phosphatase
MTVRPGQPPQPRFVVFDRDGTIIEEREYLSEPEQVRLIPGIGAALRELLQMGFGLVVITNQSGIGRGFFDRVQLEEVHERLRESLEREGVHLDGLYVCPHKPEDDCACCKPRLELLQKAARELGFNSANCIVIGDKACDIEMGHAAGALTLLVRTGYGNRFATASNADFVVDDLAAAAEFLRRFVASEETLIYSH